MIAHAVIPGMPWAVAFVLGAIVAPTDELASAPVLERFRIPRHVIAIAQQLRERYSQMRERPEGAADARTDAQRRSRAEREVIEAERQALIALRERGEIDNTVLRQVILILDLSHTRIRV